MKTFDFVWTVGKTSGSFKVDANRDDNAWKIAVLIAQDRSGKAMLTRNDIKLISVTDWV